MSEQNLLIGRFYGLLNGERVYRVKRGHFQIQDPAHPERSAYDGTKRECEKASGGKIIEVKS